MIDKSLIGGKIKNIEGYIKEIESILFLDTKTILSNIEKKDAGKKFSIDRGYDTGY